MLRQEFNGLLIRSLYLRGTSLWEKQSNWTVRESWRKSDGCESESLSSQGVSSASVDVGTTSLSRIKHVDIHWLNAVIFLLLAVFNISCLQGSMAFPIKSTRKSRFTMTQRWGTSSSFNHRQSVCNFTSNDRSNDLSMFQERNNCQSNVEIKPEVNLYATTTPQAESEHDADVSKLRSNDDGHTSYMGNQVVPYGDVSLRNESKTSKETSPADDSLTIPRHIAFVCDGNARWARQRHLPIAAGHAAGADRLVELIKRLTEMTGVQYATFYAFSSENWKRSEAEIQHIFNLMERTAKSMVEQSRTSSIAIRILGDIKDSRIPTSLRSALINLEEKSQTNPDIKLTVSIAVNYSARNDMVEAVRAIAMEGIIAPENITQGDIRSHLSTRNIPDPDLIVRTSGENRLSNWLLWEAAYAEFFVSQVHWPDFDAAALQDALDSYSLRQRRYGGRVD